MCYNRQKGMKDMVSKQNIEQDYYDGWEGLAEEIKKYSKIVHSQCHGCKNATGTHTCKVFGEKPDHYASALMKIPCPERIVSTMDITVFKEKLLKLQEQVLAKRTLVHNEENTKQALINPFLLFLGYDVHNPDEVEFEFNISFSYKNSDKVDYAIKVSSKPIFFIEAKRLQKICQITMHNWNITYLPTVMWSLAYLQMVWFINSSDILRNRRKWTRNRF